MGGPLTVEEYGFMFPGVFDGPKWATYPIAPRWMCALRLDRLRRRPVEPRGHLVKLDVEDTDLLGDVLDRAASRFGIALSEQAREVHPDASVSDIIDGVAFKMPSDDAEEWLSKLRFVRRLPVIDADSGLRIVPFSGADVASLRRAYAAGLIDGDVNHPYFRPTVSGGAFGWIASEWEHIALAYFIIKEALDGVSRGQTLYGVVRQGVTFLQTLLGAPRTVESSAPALTERGIRPNELAGLLDRREWTLPEVSLLLGMPEVEASQFLTVLGYESDDDVTWRSATSEPGLIIRASVNVVTHSDSVVQEAVEARIRYSIGYVLEHGETPPLEKVFDDSVWAIPREGFDDDYEENLNDEVEDDHTGGLDSVGTSDPPSEGPDSAIQREATMHEDVILCLSSERFQTLEPGELPADLADELRADLAELGVPSINIRFEQGSQGYAAEGETVLAIVKGILEVGPLIAANLVAWPAIGRLLRRTIRGLRAKGYAVRVSEPASLALALDELKSQGYVSDGARLLASHVIPVEGGSIPEDLRGALRRQPDRFYMFVVRTEDNNTHLLVTRSSGELEHYLRLPTGDWTEYYGT